MPRGIGASTGVKLTAAGRPQASLTACSISGVCRCAPATAYAETASLRAKIDPYGFAVTSCEVQYVTEAEFNEAGYAKPETAPCSPAQLEAGFTPDSVSAHLTGLSVSTTYHYRFVTSNASKATLPTAAKAAP